jgi:ABC-type xylose transport system permease subunit
MSAGEEARAGVAAESRSLWSAVGRFAPLIFLLAMMIVFAVLEPRFLDPTNLFNVMRQISITGLIALGMTFVILTAGIDLSVGAVLALSGIIAASIAKGTTGNTLSLDPDEATGYYIEEIIEGNTIGQALAAVQYDENELKRQMKSQIDAAIKSDRLKPSEGMRLLDEYERGLKEYTYLSI